MSHKDYETQVDQIRENLSEVYKRMERAAEKSDRDVKNIKLIAVTKMMPVETIRAGIDAGLCCFGENYAEQAAEKITDIETNQPIEWHMIGHIQSRKAETVCTHFDWVHSLDRKKIASYLDRYAGAQDRVIPVLMEVNVSGEDSKFGWEAFDESRWYKLVTEFREIIEYSNIKIRGLMSMPPLFDNAELSRPYYQRLIRLQRELRDKLPDASWDELSIGTSFDYEVAIEEGATMVRVGTRIFGDRPKR